MRRVSYILLACVLLCPFTAVAQTTDAQAAFLLVKAERWQEARTLSSRNPELRTLVEWQYVRSPSSGASFADIQAFIKANPHWPDMTQLRNRAEVALAASAPSPSEVIQWFGATTPNTAQGKLAFASAKLATGAARASVQPLIRQAWVEGDFSDAEMQRLLSTYASDLRTQDHIARTDRLLWDEKYSAARTMLELLPAQENNVFAVRMALLRREAGALKRAQKLPSNVRSSPAMQFAFMMIEQANGQDAAVLARLRSLNAAPPYAERWWPVREKFVRRAIFEKNYALARELLKFHGLKDSSNAAEAEWLSGWLNHKRGQHEAAYRTFYAMYEDVELSVSKARAAYWAAEAADALNDAPTAKRWYEIAASYPTTFYGQRAIEKQRASLRLDASVEQKVTADDVARFLASPLGRMLALCIEANEPVTALKLARHAVDNNKSARASAIIVRALERLASQTVVMKTAKRSMQKNVFIKAGYPRVSLPQEVAVEPALALAIIRQESEFDAAARSNAGAVGMMQLLPSTAREVARKMDRPFSDDYLLNPQINIILGSTYLARLINSFDGSLPLAVAAYNAGPGRVREWQAQLGTPSQDWDAIIDWSEHVPFEETRNYIHRVLENYTVYKHL